MTVDIVCDGPGPHLPADRVLGTADRPVKGMRCRSDTCVIPEYAKDGNEQTLRQQALDSITALRTSIDTLKAITDKTNADIGPADTKAVARETRRVARQVLAVSRLLLGALDSTDTGTQ